MKIVTNLLRLPVGHSGQEQRQSHLLFFIVIPMMIITPAGYLFSINTAEKEALLYLIIPASYLVFIINLLGKFRFASVLVIASVLIPPFYIAVSSQITDPEILRSWISWTFLGLFLGTILLPFTTYIYIWFGNLTVIVLLPFFIPELKAVAVAQSFVQYTIIGVIILISSYLKGEDFKQIDIQNIKLTDAIKRHKDTETALRESETRNTLSHIFAKIDIFEINIANSEIQFPEQFQYLLGREYTSSRLTISSFLEYFHPEDRADFKQAFDFCIQGNPFRFTHRIIAPDGSIRWLEEAGNVIRDENNNPEYLLGVIQDITEKKEFELKLEQASKSALEANQAKSNFLASMSHELRTPLNAVLGFSQLIEMEDSTNESQKAMAQEIIKAGNHLLRLINDILDLAKIEAGKINIALENIDTFNEIDSAMSLIGPIAKRHEIQVINSITSDIPFIFADVTRFRQIIVNLLTNAIKYNHKNGFVRIRHSTFNNMVRIEISDNGLGIAKDKQNQIFEPFSRLGQEASSIEGTGIGLSLTKKLTELMHGNIGFTSEENSGSTFWVEFPLIDSRYHEPNPNQKNGSSNYFNSYATKKILYIEDNEANLLLIKKIFSSLNVEMFFATNGEEGLKIATELLPDLVITDINLKGLNGFEILSELSKMPETKNIPVIALSAIATKNEIEQGILSGFSHYFTKPFDVRIFLKIISDLLEKTAVV